MVTYIPNRETFTGSEATGSDGGSNRTITLAQTGVVITDIVVSGTSLHEGTGKDYTLSGNVITFLNALWDDQPIDVSYLYSSSTASESVASLKYTTPLNFNQSLEMASFVPDYPTTTSKENIGTGDGSTTVFYLDKAGSIENSETLYTGSTAESGATTTLTRTTDYAVDYDKSEITLTGTGVSTVGSTSIFGEYQYNKYNKRNSATKNALERAEDWVDTYCNTVFTTSGVSTPEFVSVTNELHTGKGSNNRVYQAEYAPLNSSTTTLSGALSASATTVSVASTTGFLGSGTFAVATNKVTYTGKTSNTFTGCTGVTTAVSDATTVTSYVIERALDAEGNSPTYTVMQPDTDYSIDTDAGEVKLVNTNISSEIILDNFHPPATVWDRVRLSYQYGYVGIPTEIVRVVHNIAGKELFQSNVLNALSRGTNGFETGSIDNVDDTNKSILNKYKIWLFKSTKEQ